MCKIPIPILFLVLLFPLLPTLPPLQVRFFINNDKFFKGAVIAVSAEKFRTFEKLLEHLTRIMCNQVFMQYGYKFEFV